MHLHAGEAAKETKPSRERATEQARSRYRASITSPCHRVRPSDHRIPASKVTTHQWHAPVRSDRDRGRPCRGSLGDRLPPPLRRAGEATLASRAETPMRSRKIRRRRRRRLLEDDIARPDGKEPNQDPREKPSPGTRQLPEPNQDARVKPSPGTRRQLHEPILMGRPNSLCVVRSFCLCYAVGRQ